MVVHPKIGGIGFEVKHLCGEIRISLIPGGCDEELRGEARCCGKPAEMGCVCSTFYHLLERSPPVQKASPVNISFRAFCGL